jgi:hypothetical protein
MKKIIIPLLLLISVAACSQTNTEYVNSTDSFNIHVDHIPEYTFTPNTLKAEGKTILTDTVAVKVIDYNTDQTAIPWKEGRDYYDAIKKNRVQYNNRSGTALDVGREGRLRGINMTGGTIDDGEVVRIDSTDGVWHIYFANAAWDSTARGTIGFATEDITASDTGEVALWGDINNINTTGCPVGLIYLDTIDGQHVSVPPPTPAWVVQLGHCGRTHATLGVINAKVDVLTNTRDVLSIFNGAIIESHIIEVSSNGTNVQLKLFNSVNSLTLFFDNLPVRFSIPDSINLTAGSDISPTRNYVYIPNSTRVLTVSTSSFPTSEQYVPVADVFVQSAVSAQVNGVYKVHAWTDHLNDANMQGHLSHVNEWIRNQNATWLSGVLPTISVGTNGGGLDTIKYSHTSGQILQLHTHSYPVIDLQSTDSAYVINDEAVAYEIITNLGSIDTDNTGASLRSNNTYYSLIAWGSVSEDSADCQLFINKPSGFYGSEITEEDLSNYAVFTIPTEYKGTGFLIAKINIRYQTTSSGTFTVTSVEDLRGLFPASAAGGGAITGGEAFDNSFFISNVTDNTKKIGFDASGITTGNTRTITMPDVNTTLLLNAAITTAGTTTSLGGNLNVGATNQAIFSTGDYITDDGVTGMKFFINSTSSPVILSKVTDQSVLVQRIGGYQYIEPVASFSAFTGDAVKGYLAVPSDRDSIYWHNGTSWELLNGGGGTPAGSDTEIQYNNSGAFAGNARMKYAFNTLRLTNELADTALYIISTVTNGRSLVIDAQNNRGGIVVNHSSNGNGIDLQGTGTGNCLNAFFTTGAGGITVGNASTSTGNLFVATRNAVDQFVIDSTGRVFASDSVYLNYAIDAEGDIQWAALSPTGALFGDSLVSAGRGLFDYLEPIESYLSNTKVDPRTGLEELYWRYWDGKKLVDDYNMRGGPSKVIHKLQWGIEHSFRYIEQLEIKNKKLEEKVNNLEDRIKNIERLMNYESN